MDNIFDYLKWRGDLTFEKSPICMEDVALLTQISYCPFEELIGTDYKGKTLKQIRNYLYKDGEPESNWDWVIDCYKLWNKLTTYERYANIKMVDFTSKFDDESNEQFAAITYVYGKNRIITFRGTDVSIVGWKENLELGYLSETLSQKDSVKYIDNLSVFFGNTYVAGHSKGGNLAIYSTIKSKKEKKITQVYNFDGPGISKEIRESDEWKKISDKVLTILPTSSMIGILIGYWGNYKVVNSSAKGFNQHDMFSWEFDGPHYNWADSLSKTSIITSKVMHEFFEKSNPKDRKVLAKTLSKILDATNADSTENLVKSIFSNWGKVVKASKDLSDEDKEVLNKLKVLFKENGIDVIKNMFK